MFDDRAPQVYNPTMYARLQDNLRATATSKIVRESQRNPLAQIEHIIFRWQGDSEVAVMRDEFAPDMGWLKCSGKVVVLGELRLRVLDVDVMRQCYYVERDSWRAWVHFQRYTLTWRFDLAYRRVILTLVIWGLADYRERLPTWRDIRLLRRVAEKIEHVRRQNHD